MTGVVRSRSSKISNIRFIGAISIVSTFLIGGFAYTFPHNKVDVNRIPGEKTGVITTYVDHVSTGSDCYSKFLFEENSPSNEQQSLIAFRFPSDNNSHGYSCNQPYSVQSAISKSIMRGEKVRVSYDEVVQTSADAPIITNYYVRDVVSLEGRL